ncbi:putative NADH:ubiquinone oxidoreductase, subunit RnfC [Thermanaerovibrio velox DSM 12556]|uniref:Putative NADH:ubiquinone oxidoreductase, subunit RnfC n=1 Tax=Thermanaerovibrio velox DSM 12556 TaxID=926567 RepID=H0UQ75_9BACT|nr:4Fe-4S dicluster domain-containing protein [Thermanaerovibrio velox]EHM10713.1 putative NADH:ubiquinone oxidoreductase, subunit RnfC [Thermanaerovibrio velox DSM 12556]
MEDLLSRVREAGVVGAGGAGFPTHVKLKGGVEHLILNGAECEPLLEVDQHLAEAHGEELLEAMNLLVSRLGALEGILAFKGKYKGVLEVLGRGIGRYPKLRLHVLPNVYPAGDEQVLVYEATGRIVPEGGIPLEVGAVVINVETLYNVSRALEGLPVTHKYLTVCGEVARPSTIRVPVGVSFAQAVDVCGGAVVGDWVAVDGGPMMGRVVEDPSEPVVKTTKGIIVLPRDHPLVVSKMRKLPEMMRLAKTACCHCMLCTDLCPRYLLGHKLRPDKLMRLAAYNDTCEKDAMSTEAFLCCECGMCEVACVMGLQPWKLNRELKLRMSRQGIRNPHRSSPGEVNPFRRYRGFPTGKLLGRLGLGKYGAVHTDLREAVDFPWGKLVLKFKQHIGSPAVPLVSPGDTVSPGQLVARPEGEVSAGVHAPLAGVVVELLGDRMVIQVS